MKSPNAPGKGQNGDDPNCIIQHTDKNTDSILSQVKNAPGKDFGGFDAAAAFISPEYRKLDEHDRKEIYRKVLQAQAEAKQEDDNISPLEYWLDKENGVKFTGGNLYRLIRTEKHESERLLLSAPLTIQSVLRTDYDTEIRYMFAGKQYNATIKDMVTHISANMKSTRDASKTLAELLHKYCTDQENKGLVKVQHEPVFIENGIIRVSYDTSAIDVAKALAGIRNFHPISANPHAFLSAFAYNLIAPLAYHIRVHAEAGYLFPMRVSYGRTGAAKTSTDSIFVLRGYKQDKDSGMLTNEQVATPFTFEKNMGETVLPVIVNDVSADWLTKVSTVLKNSAENPTAGDRGNPDQTVTRRRFRRALNITSNEIFAPSDDAAIARRYILEEYTEEHEKRRNITAFREFFNALPEGFMYAIFNAVFADVLLDDILRNVEGTQDACSFVNYGLDLINKLCNNHGVLPFPRYDCFANDTPDSFTELVEWLSSQWLRINETDDNGRPKAPYPEIGRSEIDKDETNTFIVYWFTGAAYKIAQRRLNLPHKTVSALFSNYVENSQIKIAAKNKFHKFSGVAGRGFALRVFKEGTFP